MYLRSTFRLTTALAACTMLAASWLTFTSADDAVATRQDRISVDMDTERTFTYPALIGDNLATTVDGSFQTPASCASYTWCDVIPITIPDPPGLSETDEYFVRVTVRWDTVMIPANDLYPKRATNDVDVYLYNDPVDPEAGRNEDGIVYASATSNQPESFTMFRPKGDFWLVVSNFSGVNTGYRVEVVSSYAPLPTVFESLPPTFVPPAPVADSKPGVITDVPDAPAPAAPRIEVPDVPSLDLENAPVPDQRFAVGFDDVGDVVDEGLAAPVVGAVATPFTEADPPSNAVLALWFLAFPLVLTATGSGVLMRRQHAAIPI